VKGIVFHHNPEDGADTICDIVCMGNLAARKIEASLANTKLDLCPDAGVLQRLEMTRESYEELCRAAVQRFEQVRTRYNVK
jgi:hypothetical protein